ncbi:winged helix-turn-helix transcriptional regulator [Polaribacter sp.]|uniref:winged helix-turn-helix transcriptional regulator n=1 Tax=Polaribacter sp. TaxID=1920175 RepID=UPI0040471CCA
MRINFRSKCPVASMLDIVGDKWSLLIVRDMLVQGKKTFKDFSISPEGIAPGILSSRLKWLEENELITKQKLPDNQKENIYLLTEKGIELAPIITEVILWSDKNLRQYNLEMFSISDIGLNQNKIKFIEDIQENYKQFVHSLIG